LNKFIKHKLNSKNKIDKGFCVNCNSSVKMLLNSMPSKAIQYYVDHRFYLDKPLEECINFVIDNTNILCLTEEEFIIKSIIE